MCTRRPHDLALIRLLAMFKHKRQGRVGEIFRASTASVNACRVSTALHTSGASVNARGKSAT